MPDSGTGTTLPMLRWSAARECPRQAIYQATDAPARERSRQEQGWLWRGKQLGRDFTIILAAEEKRQHRPYRIYVASGLKTEWPNRWRTPHRKEAAFIVENPVRWPFGILHPDIHVVETDTLLEVLSSAHGTPEQVGSKMLQLVGQMIYSGAKNGAVVVVDPSNPLDYELFPIARSSRTFAELGEQVRDRVRQVQTWAEDGTLPARVCAKPGDARSHFCRHAEHCFAGWEPPDPDVVFSTPEALEAATELYRAKQDERAFKAQYDLGMSRRRQAEQRVEDLLELADHRAGKILAGPVEINRIVVADRETFTLAKARTAGVWTDADEERFQQFLSIGGGHVRYGVDRVSDAPLEFGGVPFDGDERDAA